MKFLIIDNYDSFVYNIAQRLGELGINSDVIRNDGITIDEIKRSFDGYWEDNVHSNLRLAVFTKKIKRKPEPCIVE